MIGKDASASGRHAPALVERGGSSREGVENTRDEEKRRLGRYAIDGAIIHIFPADTTIPYKYKGQGK